MSLLYITGGVRSGKSKFAEQLAEERGTRVLYIATGTASDGEMARRIERHRNRRPASWGTLESPYELVSLPLQAEGYDVVLMDCLSAWISNRLLQAETEEADRRHERTAQEALDEWTRWLAQIRDSAYTVIVVSSEAGMGGVAMSPLGRRFQDMLGEANQHAAHQADEVYAVLSGIPWRLK